MLRRADGGAQHLIEGFLQRFVILAEAECSIAFDNLAVQHQILERACALQRRVGLAQQIVDRQVGPRVRGRAARGNAVDGRDCIWTDADAILRHADLTCVVASGVSRKPS
jgi:hypothetical protein